MRVLIQSLHVAVRRRAIEVVVALLDVFAMVSFGTRHAEQAFFDDRVTAIPQSDRETESALTVTDTQQTVFTPPIGSAASLIVREVTPSGITAFAVIFANSAPLAFRQVRSPTLPILFSFSGVDEA